MIGTVDVTKIESNDGRLGFWFDITNSDLSMFISETDFHKDAEVLTEKAVFVHLLKGAY